MKDLLKKIANTFGYKISKSNPVYRYPAQRERKISHEDFFDLYFSMINPDDFYFAQIGANDGKSRDLLHEYIIKYNLKGILVEPQPNVFEKLKESYGESQNLAFASVALSDITGEQPFYMVKENLINEDNYFEVTAIASFNKEVFLETLKKRIPRLIPHISENLNDYIEEVQISALTFSDFVSKFEIKKIDFLFLDCEGYDFQILKSIDFNIIKPTLINFESKFLNDQDRSECEQLLESNRYNIFRYENDTCAFRIK